MDRWQLDTHGGSYSALPAASWVPRYTARIIDAGQAGLDPARIVPGVVVPSGLGEQRRRAHRAAPRPRPTLCRPGAEHDFQDGVQ